MLFSGYGCSLSWSETSGILMTITAQDLYNYTKCAHRVYLDAHGDPAERSEVGEFVRLLWEMGLQTEREHLAGLAGIPYEDLSALPIEKAL